VFASAMGKGSMAQPVHLFCLLLALALFSTVEAAGSSQWPTIVIDSPAAGAIRHVGIPVNVTFHLENVGDRLRVDTILYVDNGVALRSKVTENATITKNVLLEHPGQHDILVAIAGEPTFSRVTVLALTGAPAWAPMESATADGTARLKTHASPMLSVFHSLFPQ
jgi:hypothetical protein